MSEKFNVPEAVHAILNVFDAAGYEAWIVGGCVRDSLMGRVPKDWDITTAAAPETVQTLFAHTIDTGLKHGTVTVRMNGENYEVTTYRVDGAYSDHRRPDHVAFSTDLKEDLLRRDFTINAMAYHPKKGLIDLYGGREDLRSRRIRCVGTPADRFQEDALRMLRALRFSAQLDFTIEPATEAAIRMLAPQIAYVSWERIRDELNKILISDHPETVRAMYDTGLMHYVIPEWEACMQTEQHHPTHRYNVGEHTIRTLQAVGPEPVLRWTMFLHDIGKPVTHTRDEQGIDHFIGHEAAGEKIADEVLRRLKFDNASRETILRLIRYHDLQYVCEEGPMRRYIRKVGADAFPLLLQVLEADAQGKAPEAMEQSLGAIRKMRAEYDRITAAGEAVSLKQLAVNGRDLQAIGYRPGPGIGRMLDLLLDQVLEDPSLNDRDLLLAIAEKCKI